MKRVLCIFLVAVLLSGCTGEAPEPESTVPEVSASATLATESSVPPETSPIDYAGEEPTEEELAAFFINYAFESYEDFPNVWDDPELMDKIYYIGAQDNYACVYVESAGTLALIWDITVFQYECHDGQILVTDQADGECPNSAGLSINHTLSDGRNIYYGAVSDYHWDLLEHVKIPIDWKILRFTDAEGHSVDIDMAGKLAYLCVLDAPLADFQIIDQGDNVCVTYEEYIQQFQIQQCEPIWERDFRPIEE